MFKNLEHKKTKHPYVEPQVKDAQTIETETQVTNSEFSKLIRNLIRLTTLEQEIVDDLLKDLEFKKTKHPYVEPQVKDAQTVEIETQVTKAVNFQNLNRDLIRLTTQE